MFRNTACFLLTLLVLFFSAASVMAEPLKIAFVESLSGSQTSTGRLYVIAARYVLDEINAQGGYNGEPIQIIEYDNGGGTTGAAEKFQKAAADGVHIVLQGSSSAIAGQVTESVRKYNIRHPGNEVLYINTGAEAMELTGEKAHFYQFRFTTTAPMRINALVDVMKKEGTLGKKVYSINQNYSWGHDVETAIVDAEGKGGYETVGKVLHDVNKIKDFAPYVAQIKSANPDCIITGNWSNDLLLLMKAVNDAGLNIPMGTAFLDQIGNISNGGESTLGSYVAHTYNIAAGDVVANSKFAESYKAKTGHYPVYVEPATVNAMKMLVKALKKIDFAGGEIDITKIALALEGTSIDTPIGPVSIRKEDHQAILPVVVSKVTKNPKYPVDGTAFGFTPIKVVQGKDAIYPVQPSVKFDRPN